MYVCILYIKKYIVFLTQSTKLLEGNHHILFFTESLGIG